MTGGPTGGVSEGNVRDPNHPSHPQTPLNKGLPDNHVRDEHILLESTHYISLWRLQVFLSSLHTYLQSLLFLQLTLLYIRVQQHDTIIKN